MQSGALGGRARDWLARLPATVVGSDARLCHVSALLAALAGRSCPPHAWLSDGERAGWEGPMPDRTASLRLASLCLTAMLSFDDLGGAVATARETLAVLPAGAPVRSAVQGAERVARLPGRRARRAVRARTRRARRPGAPASGGAAARRVPPVAVLALCACERGELEAAAGFVAEAVAARELRGAPHSLPVTCAGARLLSSRGDPDAAVARCLAARELARDSSLMVPALLLELARARRRGSLRGCSGCGAGRAGPDRPRARCRRPRRRAGGVRGCAAWRGGSGEKRPYTSRFSPDPLGGARGSSGPGAAPREADELSALEVEVLRALAGSLREVADALYISRNTIKTHARALYAKLGVGTRDEAVQRGRELGLMRGALTRTRETLQILANFGAGEPLEADDGEGALALLGADPATGHHRLRPRHAGHGRHRLPAPRRGAGRRDGDRHREQPG